ncbi:MAG: FUSC family protein [Legionellaceae bacterium]|nr:FUSC family protein [Legionellaceae bacterium]
MNMLINGFKITLACLLGFWIGKQWLHLPFTQLTIISTLLVMIGEENFGSTLKKSWRRLSGAMFGAFVALFALLFWDINPWYNELILSVLIFGFAILINGSKKYQASGIFGALTLVSILLSNSPNIDTVKIRLFQVFLGVISALVVSICIRPMHTQDLLKKLLSQSLLQLNELYQINFCGLQTNAYLQNPYKFETKILKSFGDQERLLQGSMMTAAVKKNTTALYQQIILCERGLFRGTLFLSRVSKLNAQENVNIHLQDVIQTFHRVISEFIVELINYLKIPPNDSIWKTRLESALDELKADLVVRGQEPATQQAVYFYTYIGCCQYICHELETLVVLISQLSILDHKVSKSVPITRSVF